uniref:Uncharacterized protein n=1 Tax=Octopus bimaculoides TaxID=37653 RepID=A0A0L8FIW4_OCTBM
MPEQLSDGFNSNKPTPVFILPTSLPEPTAKEESVQVTPCCVLRQYGCQMVKSMDGVSLEEYGGISVEYQRRSVCHPFVLFSLRRNLIFDDDDDDDVDDDDVDDDDVVDDDVDDGDVDDDDVDDDDDDGE